MTLVDKKRPPRSDSRHLGLALIAFVYALIWSRSSPWPAILSDSVGYLVNAAIMSGHRIDAMGSWHAGYSLFLMPLFLLNDPFDVWAAAQIVNAIFVAGGAYLSSRLLVLIEPNLDRRLHFAVLFAVVLYPPFAAQAGMGQASAVLTLTVMCLACLIASERCITFGHVVVLALIAGFAYWIHPVGISVIGATGLALLSLHKKVGWRSLAFFGLVVIALAAFYKIVVHEWMYQAATPAGYQRYNHYSNSASIQQFASAYGVGRLLQYMLGHTASQLVGTFGLVLLGILYGVRQFVQQIDAKTDLVRSNIDGRKAVSIFAIVVLALAVFLGACNFLLASVWLERTDHWIYGRYSDSVVLPLLVLGVAAFLGAARSLIASRLVIVLVFCGMTGGLLAVGAVLQSSLNLSLPHSYLTSVGFWPQVVWSEKNFVVWMGFGGVGCLLLGVLWVAPKVISVSGVLLLFVVHALVSGGHHIDQRGIYERSSSQPSGLVDVVRGSWPQGSCIGYLVSSSRELAALQRTSFRLYAYMFFNYNYRRVTLQHWLQDCNGPLLTDDPLFVRRATGLEVVAREAATDLYLVTRKSQTVGNHKASNPIRALGQVAWASDFGEPCLVAGCYAWDASQMDRFSHTGVLDGLKWRTTGKAGFLFFGPYRRLDAGHYVLRLSVESTQALNAFVDVVSAQSGVTYAKQLLGQVVGANSELVLPFTLMQSVQDLQVRLYVGQQDNVAVSGYSVRMEQTGRDSAAVLQGDKP